MLSTAFLACAFLFTPVQGNTIPRWPVSKQATGIVDPGVPPKCDAWLNQVGPTEKCYVLLGEFGISEAEFLIWNPSLGRYCNRLKTGHSYCISVGTSVSEAPVPSPTKQPPHVGPPIIEESPKPVQHRATHDCVGLHKVAQGDICYTICQRYGVSLDDLHAWNDFIDASCGNLWPGQDVCIKAGPKPTSTEAMPSITQAPSPAIETPYPIQTGMTKNCTKFHQAAKGDTCHSIAGVIYKALTLEQFIEWNPSVGVECTRIYVGYNYCIAVAEKAAPPSTSLPAAPSPGPTEAPVQPGTIVPCKKYHLVNKWETCLSIGEYYGISDGDFHKWNPNVGRDCGNLWAGYRVCVEA